MFGPRPVTRKLGSMADDTCRSLHQHKPLTFPNNSKSFSSPENLSATYPIRAVTVSISSLLPDFFSSFPRSSTAFISFLISSSFCNFWFALDFCHNTHRRFSKITQWAIWRRSLWTKYVKHLVKNRKCYILSFQQNHWTQILITIDLKQRTWSGCSSPAMVGHLALSLNLNEDYVW